MIEASKAPLLRRAFAHRIATALTVATLGSSYLKNLPAAENVVLSGEGSAGEEKSHLNLGCFIYPRQDQIDFTGPFEVLSRIPNASMHVIGKSKAPFRDVKGLTLTPDLTIEEAPPLDLLLVSGGLGQQALMDDDEVLSFIRNHADSGGYVFSICTGALLCGAAGMLRGRRATTHWAAFDLLRYYGAIPTRSRVVIDGNFISTAGVTAGLDGALQVAAMLRGNKAAQEIQLEIEYAPNPPFHSGTPETAPPEVVEAFWAKYRTIGKSRQAEARRFSAKLGLVSSL